VAVVPIAYSRKFIGLFGGLGYNWSIDARKSSTEEAEKRVLEAFGKIDVLKTEARASTIEAIKRLEKYENAIGQLLVDLNKKMASATSLAD
jgi:polysaccharide pyruvyl transferase WcaK-like protein